ncbi:MAG: glycoside hydrolase family 15 protein [Actinomycetota bacterium]
MASRIEDYALIGDLQTAALVGRDGSIDWLCVPRFDSGACFAELLGTEDHGRWLLAPVAEPRAVRRRYRDGTLVLETSFETDEGAVTVIDWMPVRTDVPDLVRMAVGRRGRVRMRTEIEIRFDYGSIVPWVQRTDGAWSAVAGPDAVYLASDVDLHGRGFSSVGEFTLAEGERAAFVMAWHPSNRPPPPVPDAQVSLEETEAWWRGWSGGGRYRGEWAEAVNRSLITLKALTYAPTGGIVAAATTSLPTWIGGVRNWDYRYCWVRDATFTLLALLACGYEDEARAWRDWLLRAVAGRPEEMQIMYGPAGERRLTEIELDWLPGYEGSRPVRVGNAAHAQRQLDVYGEAMDALYQARRSGLAHEERAWHVAEALLRHLDSAWRQPDQGIWEVRGPNGHFIYSKVMAWVAFDRAVRMVEEFRLEGPVDRWRSLRDAIHDEVCREGYAPDIGSFVQSYGSKRLDASLLMIPLVGFLPPSDPRVRGTVEAVERHLMRDGLVYRYDTAETPDGLPPGEGAFLVCSFWLADCYHLLGRTDDARRLFQRLLELRNDVGLLSEQYDPEGRRMLGNFPQAFSHVGLVGTATNLTTAAGPAQRRTKGA